MTTNEPAKLFGLILAGGRSTRMGHDKSTLSYYGVPHYRYLYELLQPICEQTFVSRRTDQATPELPEAAIIPDENRYRGPFNGLLSAHHAYPTAAWLVLAVDLPLIDSASLRYLVAQRQADHVATTLATRSSQLPEPLCAIWEPAGLRQAEAYLQRSESTCPRKFLIRQAAPLVFPADDRVLTNANDPIDYQQVQDLLNHER